MVGKTYGFARQKSATKTYGKCGRPIGCRNLDVLHQRIKPFMLRRRKAEVETELPQRTDRNYFVPLSESQKQSYADHEQQVSKLSSIAQRRPLTQQEQDKLQRELAMMRMVCDTNFIPDPEDRTCPKLAEIVKLLDDCVANDAKVIIFSEWERMLELVRDLCGERGIGYAWHTGSVPQQRRRGEINAFKHDPKCRVFLSTDAGATGLNLQNASVVINCDLPWNPARLEQRIARAWRKHQTKPVTVINLISENTLEHRMLETLAMKQTVATSVLDKPGEVKEIKLRSGRQAMIERINQLVAPVTTDCHTSIGSGVKSDISAQTRLLPADPALAFVQLAAERINGALVRCEERYTDTGAQSVLMVVVEREASQWAEPLKSIYRDCFNLGESVPQVQLEIIDRATDDAIQRLINAGLISKTSRATRSLFSAAGNAEAVPLSAEELAQAKAHRELAARQLKLTRVLGNTGFAEEARGALLDAIHCASRVLAVEHRLPEPAELKEAFQPPLSHCWASALPQLKNFVENPETSWKPVAEHLTQSLKSGVDYTENCNPA